MYQVLYRKWRPQTFDDVVGQSHVTKTLENELEAGRLSHAYLFTGSRGTGKTSCAKILAKAVNCLNPKHGNPCNECENCKGIDNGSILDVVEIDAASNNGVENIRDLRDEANYTPSKALYRVYIIDEVHMLSTGAFNALLKTLEEPPEHVKFILATTEVHKIPATILSRCQRFDFKRIGSEDIAGRLEYVAGQEGFSLEHEAAMLIARIADGGMRDALSMLDQCVGINKSVTVDVVTQAIGLANNEHLFELSKAIISNDAAAALDCLDRLHNDSCDMERLCSELINQFRNYMICKAAKNPQSIIVCTADNLEKIKAVAEQISIESILYTLDLLQNTLTLLRSGADRRVAMEMAMFRLCSPKLATDNAGILKRLEALERNGVSAVKVPVIKFAEPQTAKPQAAAPQEDDGYPEAIPAPLDNAPPAEPEFENALPPKPTASESGATEFRDWPEVLDELFELDKPLKSFLTRAQAYVEGSGRLLIKTNSAALHSLLKQDEHRNCLKTAIRTVTGKDYPIAFVKPSENGVANDLPVGGKATEQPVAKDPLASLADKIGGAGVPFTIE